MPDRISAGFFCQNREASWRSDEPVRATLRQTVLMFVPLEVADHLTVSTIGEVLIGTTGLIGGARGDVFADETDRTIPHQKMGSARMLATKSRVRTRVGDARRRCCSGVQWIAGVAHSQVNREPLPVGIGTDIVIGTTPDCFSPNVIATHSSW